MTSISNQFDLLSLLMTDPISKFVAEGGSWADAMEMEYRDNLIPKWSGQLRSALKKKGPSARVYCEKLTADLQGAYAYLGITGDRFQSIIASLSP